MAQIQEAYDVYLTIFGKVRSGVQLTSIDFRDQNPGTGTPPYTGEQLIAAALGAIDGKNPHAELMTKSELKAKLTNFSK